MHIVITDSGLGGLSVCAQLIHLLNSHSVPENHVVEECLGGYLLHDRIIRPAMVRVSGKS